MTPEPAGYGAGMGDLEHRVVSDLNTSYLSAKAMADIERLAIKLADGAPLTVSDYNADENGNPTSIVGKGVAQFDLDRFGRDPAGDRTAKTRESSSTGGARTYPA